LHLIDLILIVLLLAAFTAAVWIIVSNRKKGRSCLGCGGDCSSCAQSVLEKKTPDGTGKERG